MSPRQYLYFCTIKASKVTHTPQGIWDYDAKEDDVSLQFPCFTSTKVQILTHKAQGIWDYDAKEDDVSPQGWWDEQGVCVPAECFLFERLLHP